MWQSWRRYFNFQVSVAEETAKSVKRTHLSKGTCLKNFLNYKNFYRGPEQNVFRVSTPFCQQNLKGAFYVSRGNIWLIFNQKIFFSAFEWNVMRNSAEYFRRVCHNRIQGVRRKNLVKNFFDSNYKYIIRIRKFPDLQRKSFILEIVRSASFVSIFSFSSLKNNVNNFIANCPISKGEKPQPTEWQIFPLS